MSGAGWLGPWGLNWASASGARTIAATRAAEQNHTTLRDGANSLMTSVSLVSTMDSNWRGEHLRGPGALRVPETPSTPALLFRSNAPSDLRLTRAADFSSIQSTETPDRLTLSGMRSV